MTIAMFDSIPARRRTVLFSNISRIVDEVGAIDRSLEHLGEGLAADDILEEIGETIKDEVRLARTARRRRAAIVRLGDTGSAA